MRFTLIDRIVDLQPGKQITATKSLSLSEEYLQDHFPRFPVMPGVLMLEVMNQTAAWLVRATDDFQHSLVTLAEANNVKFSDFVEPGETLRVTAEIFKHEEQTYRLKCEGEVDGKVAVRGRLVLTTSRLAGESVGGEAVDGFMINSLREKFRLLYPAGFSETKS